MAYCLLLAQQVAHSLYVTSVLSFVLDEAVYDPFGRDVFFREIAYTAEVLNVYAKELLHKVGPYLFQAL